MSDISNNYTNLKQPRLRRTDSNGYINLFPPIIIPTINTDILNTISLNNHAKQNDITAIEWHSPPGVPYFKVDKHNDISEKNYLNDIEWHLPPGVPYFKVDEDNPNPLTNTLYTIQEEDEEEITA